MAMCSHSIVAKYNNPEMNIDYMHHVLQSTNRQIVLLGVVKAS